jgi:hypothetical protein
MISNNHKKSGCGFAEELVSYLYGEMSAAENAGFEKHLAACSVCADELDAFSGVQFSINDWKIKDFANLQTPLIEIPYPVAAKNPETGTVETSWLAGIRKLFSPPWSLAAGSFAALAVCVGIFLYVSKSPQKNDVAINNNNTKIAVSPTVEKSPVVSNSNEKPGNVPEPKPLDKPIDKPQTELAVENDPKNKPVVKTTNTTRRAEKAETSNLPKTNEAQRNNKKKDEVPPKIYEEDEEDDTLRLAEMFEEIDTVE